MTLCMTESEKLGLRRLISHPVKKLDELLLLLSVSGLAQCGNNHLPLAILRNGNKSL